ncbi:MAG: HAD hydrolase-like protein [Oscillospiraceae bacterium]|nr:HAD hydrolase-like protein [Oscillospiraceae bacterium]
MKQKAVFFDLDGTISDSGPGITRCAREALYHFGIPDPGDAAMRTFVGPPLRDMFRKYGVPGQEIETAMQVYRKNYLNGGILECTMYPGIRELLDALHQHGRRLFVATAKPEPMAVEVLEYFGILGEFEAVCGASLDKSRDSKAAVIRYLLEQLGECDAVMVGDTAFDVIGAAEHNIPTIGVSWGYGSAEEMKNAGAAAVADTVDELIQILCMEENGK